MPYIRLQKYSDTTGADNGNTIQYDKDTINGLLRNTPPRCTNNVNSDFQQGLIAHCCGR